MPVAFNRVLARVLGGVWVMLYKYGGFIALQQLVRTASNRETTINGVTVSPLVFWGRLFGAGDPTAATRAELALSVPVGTEGFVLEAGELLFAPDNQYTYQLLSSVTLSGTTAAITVRAVNDPADNRGRGAAGNLPAGSILRFDNTQAGVGGDVTVTAASATAANAETTEDYRRRIEQYVAARPQGGAPTDYRIWATSLAGIINAYPYKGLPGRVNVYVEATAASSGNPDGIPTAAQLTATLNAINLDADGLATRRPANSFVATLPITRTAFNVDVAGISGVDDLPAVRANIATALTTYLGGLEPFIVGLTLAPREDQLTGTRVTAIIEDIVTAAGGTFTGATVTEGNVQVVRRVMGEGERAKLGAVTYS